MKKNTPFFPKDTLHWQIEEPTAMRRFSISMWEMALLTGVVLRLYRAIVINYTATSWIWLASLFIGVLLFCAMATVHLANFPMRRWVWRAPLFALLEVSAESVTSLALIWLGREPKGSARAEFSDWFSMSMGTLVTRVAVVITWALFLAVVVFVVRKVVLRETPEEAAAEDAAQVAEVAEVTEEQH
jgi:Na+-transporting methylmalonyl-CoA/oxaloacetate decarboxylase gamma subunit